MVYTEHASRQEQFYMASAMYQLNNTATTLVDI